MTISSALLLITILVNLILAVLIYLRTKKNKVTWFYLLILLSIISWSLSLFFYHYTTDPRTALLLSKTAYVSVAASGLFFLYFCLFFPEGKSPLKLLTNFLFVIPLLLLSLSVFLTRYIIDDFIKFDAVDTERVIGFGSGYIFYPLYIMVYFALGFLVLFLKYKQAQDLLRTQIRCIYLGFFITVVFGAFFNLLLTSFGNFRYYQIGPMWTLATVISAAYAITKHHLFQIKVIFTELLVGVMGVVLLLLLLLMPSFQLRVLTIGAFILFCVFGYFLIKATYRELKAKGILEERVEERTKEVQTAYEDVKKRKEDLERFYSLTVGRELKMIELKKKIKELEEEKK